MLQVCRNHSVTFFRAPGLQRIPGVVHGFSTRRLTDELAGEGRAGFVEAVGVAGWPVGRLRQIHSDIVHRIDLRGPADSHPEGDAAYTDLRGIALEIQTADCVPILIAEPAARAVAVVHAGWRGTCQGIVRKLADSLQRDFGLDLSGLAVAIGPHIGVCCMEVGEEVVGKFTDLAVFERRPEWRKPHLNLAQANRKQLLDAGVRAEMIEISQLCTRCRADLFHSYRRDGDDAGRMRAIIGLQP